MQQPYVDPEMLPANGILPGLLDGHLESVLVMEMLAARYGKADFIGIVDD